MNSINVNEIKEEDLTQKSEIEKKTFWGFFPHLHKGVKFGNKFKERQDYIIKVVKGLENTGPDRIRFRKKDNKKALVKYCFIFLI